MRWLSNRFAAWMTGLFVIGILAYTSCIFLGNPRTTDCGSWNDVGCGLLFAEVFFVIFGISPGLAIALTLTPARTRPWRSLPMLTVSGAAGAVFFFWLAHMRDNLGWPIFLTLALDIAIPAIPILLASLFVTRLSGRASKPSS